MEQVSSYRFLAIYVTEKLSSTLHIISLVKKKGGRAQKGILLNRSNPQASFFHV